MSQVKTVKLVTCMLIISQHGSGVRALKDHESLGAQIVVCTASRVGDSLTTQSREGDCASRVSSQSGENEITTQMKPTYQNMESVVRGWIGEARLEGPT